MAYDEYRQEEAQAYRRTLPAYYYHDHFTEMLEFVGEHYAHVLNAERRAFRDDFERLSFAAQCLYVRLANRKGHLFARSRLNYPDIPELDDAIRELRGRGFLSALSVDDVGALLKVVTRERLLRALKERFVGLTTTMKKQALVEFALANLAPDEILDSLPTSGLLRMGREDDVEFWLFLYFGRSETGLSRFTMRDLGLVKASGDDNYEPRFQDLEEAEDVFQYSRKLAAFEARTRTARELADASWPVPKHATTASLRDKLAYRVGRALERDGDTYAALRVYERASSSRCTERIVRLLIQSGQRDDAKIFLERCMENPASSEEALFAEDFYARKFGGKRTSTLTDRLRAADTIQVDEAHAGSPERAAMRWFEERGAQAFRVENSLWRTFFGLLFWESLFGGPSHSPFDRLPVSLKTGRFADEFAREVEEAFDLLRDPRRLKARLLKVSVSSFGKANGIFRWRQETLDALFAMIDRMPARSMQAMLEHLVTDYKNSRYGYPDLMTIEEDVVRFVEVKTAGDQLRRNQLLRLEQLEQAGIDARIAMIEWVIDPEQDYVVVDVETTGGRGEKHRVTEIGAVRVRNLEIVDKFQTLLNPQRSIPPSITRLTGITPAMVEEAPYFSDVADEFAEFLDGAIFVAHNVEFDYRFIRAEFQRIGRRFRMPKLCTVASMRRLFPGHSSYSLKALTDTYGIELRSHHRALCDAEAAAELLLMINEKRQLALTREST